MAMKFDGRVTQGPIRGLPFTSGSLSMLAFLILLRPAGDSASPLMSFTTLDRSRILPFLSIIPGFSLPAVPKRTSFMGSPPSVIVDGGWVPHHALRQASGQGQNAPG